MGRGSRLEHPEGTSPSQAGPEVCPYPPSPAQTRPAPAGASHAAWCLPGRGAPWVRQVGRGQRRGGGLQSWGVCGAARGRGLGEGEGESAPHPRPAGSYLREAAVCECVCPGDRAATYAGQACASVYPSPPPFSPPSTERPRLGISFPRGFPCPPPSACLPAAALLPDRPRGAGCLAVSSEREGRRGGGQSERQRLLAGCPGAVPGC